MEEELSQLEEKKLKDAFFLLDSDNDQSISINEVGLLLRGLGIIISDKEIENLKSDLEKNGKLVSYDDMKKIYAERLKNNLSSEELIDAFKFFDEENTGKINLEKLKKSLMNLGEGLTKEEMKILEEELNLGKNGDINYNELIAKIQGKK